ncbi:H-NS histone family protein [Candidatus Falkowbacteria bacterium]|nr:H-NS histone family protein [Candidatus Falkowbacteria bacterium]
MSYESMTLEELQIMRRELEQKQAELDRLFRLKHKEVRQDFLRELRELISARGYMVEDIAQQLASNRRALPPEGRRYVDPDNEENYYKRGPMPPWLRDKMLLMGFNPDSRHQRDTFKRKHLKLIEE